MSSFAFDIGNFVIWSWLVLSPLFVMVIDGLHRIDKTLRYNHYQHTSGYGLHFWRGWWFDFAQESHHYLVGFLWAATIFGIALTYGNVHEEWDVIPWLLHLIDMGAEPLGWLVLLSLPIPVWLLSIKLAVFLIVKWSKK